MDQVNEFGSDVLTLLDKLKIRMGWLEGRIRGCFDLELIKEFTAGMKKTEKAVTATGTATATALKRAVMGFDELNRLNKVSGTGWTGSSFWDNAIDMVDNTKSKMTLSMESLGQKIKETVQTVKDLGQTFTDTALESDQAAQGTLNIWERLTTGMAITVGQPIKALFQDLWGNVSSSAGSSLANVQASFAAAPGWLQTSFAAPVRAAVNGLWDSLKSGSQGAWQAVQQSFGGTASFFGSTFSDAWSQVQQVFSKNGQVFQGVQGGILSAFTGVVNTLIDGINQVVCVPFQGLNGILNTLSLLSILGLKPFSWLSWRAPLPQIPHLAKGAVLPANQPFLAMVGDQRHGTNIEAPLATIQEAVAAVMQDMAQGNMAGHEATVATLQQILDAVLGIRIGDEQIGAANARYQCALSLVTGGIV